MSTPTQDKTSVETRLHASIDLIDAAQACAFMDLDLAGLHLGVYPLVNRAEFIERTPYARAHLSASPHRDAIRTGENPVLVS